MVRPKDRLAGAEAAHLPLFGREALTNADVAVMIRPHFHEDPRFLDLATRRRFARRGAVTVALLALAGLSGPLVAGLRLDDYDPRKAMLKCRWHRHDLELPVTPALGFVLDRWLECRPADKGDALLPSERGEPGVHSFEQFLRHLGWRLGTQRQLPTLLREFHRARLANAGPDAYNRYWAVQRDRRQPRPQTGEALRALVAASDPFDGRIPFLTRPHRAAAYLADSDTKLPAAAWQAGEVLQGNRPPADEPLIAALAAVKPLRGKSERIAALDLVFATHRSEIHAALTRRVSLVWLADVGGMNHRTFKRHLARADAGERVRVVPPPPPARAAPTADEARRLRDIAAVAWPDGWVAINAFRREMLKRHFAFVRRLVREQKLTCRVARQLFRMSVKQMTLRCFDFDHGVFHLAVAPRPDPKQRQIAQALAIRQYAHNPAQSWTALWRRLRLDYHYPLDFGAFASILRSYRAGRYEVPRGIAAPPAFAARA